MNSTSDAPAFAPAPTWSGRNDGPGKEHARWFSQVSRTAPDSPGIALLGFASDEGVARNGGRQGAAAGPQALRDALGSLAIHDDRVLFDAGTVTTQGEDLEGAHAELSAQVENLRLAGHLVVVLGGGHETAFGSHRGAFQAGGGQPLAIINLDAHFDLRSAPQATSGTPFKQIAELVGPDNFDYTVLGISAPNNTRVLFDTADDLGTKVVLDQELLALTPPEAASLARDLSAGDKPIHLSIDLDVLPASEAPGVSAPAGLGVPLLHIRAIALAVAATGRLALVDVVELNPKFDVDSHTAKVAARLIDDITATHWAAISA
ncbi:formimidoylglutamase [Corynebacterium phocae]|uniref:Formimidoylglutamase n=1 Tax=Corynebacterium phocae TaxID=161895 RepID=A0A1L7D4D7_9CORY|nr:formimidoylglutamase [Corynebacterium phocae]APT92802.1 formimidoylglutamase [Corynebacterium phocae]KAA8723114.1 formimidoylglutamase [Corynebacterium phocae]